MTQRKYTIRLLSIIVLVLIIVGCFNRIIDPFWYYQDIEISGLNKIKPKFRKYERNVKPKIVARTQPDALIFGSSFSEIGLDPTNRAFTNNGKLNGYNFGMAGAGWDRVQCYFDYALKETKVKRIVIGISPGSMPKTNCKGILPEVDNFSELNLLFSMIATVSSVNTILEQGKSSPSHTKNGMYYYIRGNKGIDHQFSVFYRDFEKQNQCNLKHLRNISSAHVNMDYQLPEINTSIDIDGLKKVIKMANEKNIELRIYIYPSHALWQEINVICGNYKNYWANLLYIVQELEKEGGNVELWDFNQYNDFTGETITSQSAIYWQDPEHFNYEFGNFILEAMFDKKKDKTFGVKLTSKNITLAYKEYIKSRDKYIKSHNDLFLTLDKILQ